jgi:hypothetical protein
MDMLIQIILVQKAALSPLEQEVHSIRCQFDHRMGERTGFENAAIGAVVTIVLSFTGFSALLGGGIAGYLQ